MKDKKSSIIKAITIGRVVILILFLFLFIGGWFVVSTPLVRFYDEAGKRRVSFSVEIAKTQEEQEKGLMFRKELGAKKGMLFVFEEPDFIRMWMKDTEIPLDIIFMDENKVVKCVRENAIPQSLVSISCPYRVLYVLEINAGKASKFGIVPGFTAKFNNKY